jgi:glucose/mannose-6-phosphate isomerase
MLDDLKFIHQRDSQDALGIAQKQAEQLTYDFQVEPITGAFSNIVFAGMGGSPLAALLSQTWPGHKLPFEVCRQYHIPSYVSEPTLFIASSYSGNTEETLSGLAEAEAKGAKIVVIAGGGKLIEIAKEKSYPYLILPKVGMPRYGVLYSFNALVTLLRAAGFAGDDQVAELKNTSKFLENSVAGWLPTVPKDNNPAKQLAMELAGKSIVIYAGPLLAPAAYKWKISFNENSKNLAWWNEYPEWNHNETSGWIGQPVDKVYGIVDLRSNLEHEKIQKRFELMERLLSGKRPAPNVVQAQGESILQQMLWTVVFGDFVSLYLALLNNIDPSPVDLQEKIKVELNK